MLPLAPAAPKNNESPVMGGLLALPVVQLPLAEKLVDVPDAPPCQVSFPLPAHASGMTARSRTGTARAARRRGRGKPCRRVARVGMDFVGMLFVFTGLYDFKLGLLWLGVK